MSAASVARNVASTTILALRVLLLGEEVAEADGALAGDEHHHLLDGHVLDEQVVEQSALLRLVEGNLEVDLRRRTMQALRKMSESIFLS